jgi:hypothetical protein
MAFTQTNAPSPISNYDTAGYFPQTMGQNRYGMNGKGGSVLLNQYQPVNQLQQPVIPQAPAYEYAPPAFVPPTGLQGLLSNETLYTNPNAPWAIQQNATQEATAPVQGDSGNQGWDSSAFMQGLQSLGYNL